MSVHKRRNTKAGKKELDKRSRERLRQHHKDPEIDALLRIYGDRVKILEDSRPLMCSFLSTDSRATQRRKIS